MKCILLDEYLIECKEYIFYIPDGVHMHFFKVLRLASPKTSFVHSILLPTVFGADHSGSMPYLTMPEHLHTSFSSAHLKEPAK